MKSVFKNGVWLVVLGAIANTSFCMVSGAASLRLVPKQKGGQSAAKPAATHNNAAKAAPQPNALVSINEKKVKKHYKALCSLRHKQYAVWGTEAIAAGALAWLAWKYGNKALGALEYDKVVALEDRVAALEYKKESQPTGIWKPVGEYAPWVATAGIWATAMVKEEVRNWIFSAPRQLAYISSTILLNSAFRTLVDYNRFPPFLAFLQTRTNTSIYITSENGSPVVKYDQLDMLDNAFIFKRCDAEIATALKTVIEDLECISGYLTYMLESNRAGQILALKKQIKAHADELVEATRLQNFSKGQAATMLLRADLNKCAYLLNRMGY